MAVTPLDEEWPEERAHDAAIAQRRPTHFGRDEKVQAIEQEAEKS
jgi:hypothetical protein